jgi:hypothetical protein
VYSDAESYFRTVPCRAAIDTLPTASRALPHDSGGRPLLDCLSSLFNCFLREPPAIAVGLHPVHRKNKQIDIFRFAYVVTRKLT